MAYEANPNFGINGRHLGFMGGRSCRRRSVKDVPRSTSRASVVSISEMNYTCRRRPYSDNPELAVLFGLSEN